MAFIIRWLYVVQTCRDKPALNIFDALNNFHALNIWNFYSSVSVRVQLKLCFNDFPNALNIFDPLNNFQALNIWNFFDLDFLLATIQKCCHLSFLMCATSA